MGPRRSPGPASAARGAAAAALLPGAAPSQDVRPLALCFLHVAFALRGRACCGHDAWALRFWGLAREVVGTGASVRPPRRRLAAPHTVGRLPLGLFGAADRRGRRLGHSPAPEHPHAPAASGWCTSKRPGRRLCDITAKGMKVPMWTPRSSLARQGAVPTAAAKHSARDSA